MKGLGLVFAGGGGKGAYEIGVWKYLHELGLDSYIQAVSGTSVGALNAALFVGGTFEEAEELWMNIEPNTILTPKKITVEDIMKWLVSCGIGMNNPVVGTIGKLSSQAIAITATGMESLIRLFLSGIRSDSFFSREGLISLIHDGVNAKILQSSDISCFVTCLRLPGLGIERFRLNDYEAKDITQLLLASSAIPMVFPNEIFCGQRYCDGGLPVVGDNVPIQPVYDRGIENIIVIHLKQDAVIDKSKYPGARIIEIVPSIDLGNIFSGTLDFTTEGSMRRIELGYADAKKALQPMVEMIMLNGESKRLLQQAEKRMEAFEQKRSELREEERKMRKEASEDGFDELFPELVKER